MSSDSRRQAFVLHSALSAHSSTTVPGVHAWLSFALQALSILLRFKSISSHVARLTSPERQAVNVRNSKARTVPAYAPDSRILASAVPTSAYGSARW